MKQEGKNLPISKYLLSEKDINLLKNYVKQHKDKIGKLIYINPKTNNNIILKVALIIEHSYVLLVMIYIVLPTLMQHFPNYKLLFAVIGFIGLLGYLKLSYQRLVWLTNEQKKARNRFLIETSSLLLGVALLYYSNLLFFSMFSLYPTIYINRMITIKFVEVLDN
ncbi:hypothetical protein JOC73_003015 [Alkaliphilus hydrothermalis]|uniref:Uncharacterized protein n=2 Tax=Alkaliphilus hydrothermalis TaxID=1482730 RepID=A0ABS2NU06_9FIRM|nr:hypothetical protein [Alkaliphilus hydrothermalis]